MPNPQPRVALFVTCLVDLYRPTVGFAAIRLLQEAGCQVELPRAQTCCGQPAYNSGDRATARDLARGIIEAFIGYDYVVVPSGSCGGMLKTHLPHLFDDGPNPRAHAAAAAARRVGFACRGRPDRVLPSRSTRSSRTRTLRHPASPFPVGSRLDQPPFTPPAVSPATISFCISSVRISTGPVTTSAAAASGPQLICSKVSTL